jgi:hypothetical protein
MNVKSIFLLWLTASIANASSLETIPTSYDKNSLWDAHGPIKVKQVDIALKSGKKLEQRLAYLYIYGVLDSTEGELWCNRSMGPGGIKGLAVHAINKSVEVNPDERAATVIIEQFRKTSPCKEAQ